MSEPEAIDLDRVNKKSRVAASVLAALAALMLTVAPAAVEARSSDAPHQIATVHGSVGPAEALVAPGQPPKPCTPGRYKCPLGTGLL